MPGDAADSCEQTRAGDRSSNVRPLVAMGYALEPSGPTFPGWTARPRSDSPSGYHPTTGRAVIQDVGK